MKIDWDLVAVAVAAVVVAVAAVAAVAAVVGDFNESKKESSS